MAKMAKQRVLILCTGNSARSQLAEGWLRTLGGERFAVFSAGTAPKPAVHPLALQVMSEAGIDLTAHRPKDVRRFLGQSFDCIITVCDNARDTCPTFPGHSGNCTGPCRTRPPLRSRSGQRPSGRPVPRFAGASGASSPTKPQPSRWSVESALH